MYWPIHETETCRHIVLSSYADSKKKERNGLAKQLNTNDIQTEIKQQLGRLSENDKDGACIWCT
jgi:hypothetical protein